MEAALAVLVDVEVMLGDDAVVLEDDNDVKLLVVVVLLVVDKVVKLVDALLDVLEKEVMFVEVVLDVLLGEEDVVVVLDVVVELVVREVGGITAVSMNVTKKKGSNCPYDRWKGRKF